MPSRNGCKRFFYETALKMLSLLHCRLASREEHSSPGLNRCTAAERSRLQSLNEAYGEKFGFPLCRRGAWPQLERYHRARLRALAHERTSEIEIALEEIGRIARFRPADTVRS